MNPIMKLYAAVALSVKLLIWPRPCKTPLHPKSSTEEERHPFLDQASSSLAYFCYQMAHAKPDQRNL